MEDASGFKKISYGKMGEVIEENHTFVLPNEQHQYTFTMKYSYDSWNRLQNITYPDGEVVRYSYDCGGMLTKITGEYTVEGSQSHTVDTGGISFRKGFQLPDIPVNPTTTYHYHYVDSICYNQFGLKEKQFFGNSTRAEYAYDSLQRLKSMVCLNSRNTVFQELFYTYDAVSNITGIRNTASSDLGGPYSFNYEYDTLYRLKNFKGNHQVNSIRYGDTVQMAYHNDGRISRKTQKYTSVLNGNMTDVNNVWNYEYSQTQPHTVSSIENKTPSLSWDANGNMTSSDGTNLTWDEENRLSSFHKGGIFAFYRYDGNGERYYKNTTNLIRMNVNGNAKLPPTVYANPVLYASPYLVATKQGYTKHYYAGDERFLSKIGDGVITGISNHVKDGTTLSAKQDEVDHATPPGSFSGNLEGLLHLTDEMKGKPELYWQHSDHLGSASWITDTSGNAVQHLMYMPWGEPLVDVRNPQISYNARYTFASKERDEESGLSYFGARYYSSDLSIWLSVDPMSDKYPSLSPYVYCADNPVKLVDPNGEEVTKFEDANGNLIKQINDGSNAVFKETGAGIRKHYSFSGYDDTQGGVNEVNIGTAIQEQQIMNNDNPALQQSADGTTFCNFATQNVMETVASVPNNENALVTGSANTMINKMEENSNYVRVSKSQALSYGKTGLAVVAYKNTSGHGHLATISAGDNRGEVANIGPSKYSGFTTINGAISKDKTKRYYIYKNGGVSSPVNIN